jgi:hypothetical protein
MTYQDTELEHEEEEYEEVDYEDLEALDPFGDTTED